MKLPFSSFWDRLRHIKVKIGGEMLKPAEKEALKKQRNQKVAQFATKEVVMVDEMEVPQKMEMTVSMNTVFRSTAAVLLTLMFASLIFQLSNVLVLFVVSFLIAAALDPVIDFFQRKRLPRALGISLVYLFMLVIVTLLISQLLPVLAKQLLDIGTLIGKFFANLPTQDFSQLPFGKEIRPYLEQVYQAIDFHTVASQLQSYLQIISTQILSFGGNLWTVILAISNGLMNLILVLIIVFFMTVDENAVEKMCLSVFPKKYSGYISEKMGMIKQSIGHWIRGQFNVSVVAAVMTFIGLAIFGVQYSLTLAVVAGMMMVIPVFGRVFAWLFSLPIVFNQSPALALWLTIYYFLLSQVENNFMIPYLMNKAVGLSPIIIIFSLLVGSQFLGILGLILAIPVATVIALFVKDFTRKVE